MPEKPGMHAALRSRTVYVHPCIMLDISKPMNIAAPSANRCWRREWDSNPRYGFP
jgi:hypothetical protein